MNTSRSRKDDGGYVAKLLANWTMLWKTQTLRFVGGRGNGEKKRTRYAYFIKMVLVMGPRRVCMCYVCLVEIDSRTDCGIAKISFRFFIYIMQIPSKTV